MSDRGLLFIFSILMALGALAVAGWLVVSGQAGTVDGLFLLLTALLTALCFVLYVVFLIRRAMEVATRPAAAQTAKAGASAPGAKPAPATVSQT
jgi:small-conductance mechanosensitive channel